MITVLVAGLNGCRVFGETCERETELVGRPFSVLSSGADETCVAAIEGHEIWRRGVDGLWEPVATVDISLQSIASIHGTIIAGGADEAAIVRVALGGEGERLSGFDDCSGRAQWFAGGPPLGVRSIAATCDGAAVIAAVHVGGLPYSTDNGDTWKPTVPIMYDVHEVRAHPTLPNLVAAASAVGLLVSYDGGRAWVVISDGLEITNSLAVCILNNEVLFGIADGPFAEKSQLWRWVIGAEHVERVRDDLPEWLDGKVDTAQLAAGCGRAAFVDGGGSLWLSGTGSKDWKCLATDISYPFGIAVVSY